MSAHHPRAAGFASFSPESAAEFLDCETLRLYLDFVLRNFQVDGLLFRRVGRSALRPGPVPRACEVDGPPALFSQAEENLRPRLAGSLYLQARLERAQGRGAATAA